MKIFDWIPPPRRHFNSSGFPLIKGGSKNTRQSQGSLNTEEMKPLLSSEKAMMTMDADVFDNWKLDGILTIGTLAIDALEEIKQQQQQEQVFQEETTPDHRTDGEENPKEIDHVVESSSTGPSCDVKMLHSSLPPSSDSFCIMTCNSSDILEGISSSSSSSIEKAQKLIIKGKMIMMEPAAGRRVTLLDLFNADSHHTVVHQKVEEDNGVKTKAAEDDLNGHRLLKKNSKTSGSWSKKPLLILSEKPDKDAVGRKKSMSSKAKKLFSRVKKIDQLLTRMSERKIHPSDMNDVAGTNEKKGSQQKNKNKYYEMIPMHPTHTSLINSGNHQLQYDS